MLKFCKDCFYHSTEPAAEPSMVHRCNHPDNANVVTGTAVPVSCFEMRNMSGRCGRDPAKLFKDKPRPLD
jgi:hypothetical protein